MFLFNYFFQFSNKINVRTAKNDFPVQQGIWPDLLVRQDKEDERRIQNKTENDERWKLL